MCGHRLASSSPEFVAIQSRASLMTSMAGRF